MYCRAIFVCNKCIYISCIAELFLYVISVYTFHVLQSYFPLDDVQEHAHDSVPAGATGVARGGAHLLQKQEGNLRQNLRGHLQVMHHIYLLN